jgi:hypothetical protein
MGSDNLGSLQVLGHLSNHIVFPAKGKKSLRYETGHFLHTDSGRARKGSCSFGSECHTWHTFSSSQHSNLRLEVKKLHESELATSAHIHVTLQRGVNWV